MCGKQRMVEKTHLERTHESLIDTHHCASVIEFATVIGSREQGDQLSLCKEFVAVLDYLMSSTY